MACAWLLVSGKRSIVVSTTFQFSLSPHFVLVGFTWAVVIALAGSILPALRAVRLPITAGMRPDFRVPLRVRWIRRVSGAHRNATSPPNINVAVQTYNATPTPR